MTPLQGFIRDDDILLRLITRTELHIILTEHLHPDRMQTIIIHGNNQIPGFVLGLLTGDYNRIGIDKSLNLVIRDIGKRAGIMDTSYFRFPLNPFPAIPIGYATRG